MYMTPDVVYKVTKGNTDGSIKVDDIVYVNKEDGSIVVPRWDKRFTKDVWNKIKKTTPLE